MTHAPVAPPATPPATGIGDGTGIERLLHLMQRLRDPVGGCEWDLAQSFETIAPYTIEEAYEVADAIASGNPDSIRDELGDLLLQVVFHAQIARDDGLFDFDAVAHGITDKMIRRHPHIFTDAPRPQQQGEWESIKAAERSKEQASGALAGVALALPALKRAEKLQARAARVGFDWPDISGPIDKLQEEIGELTDAVTQDHRFEEMGDLLFAAANVARKYGIDPEAALAAANRKFEARFAGMEARAGGTIDGLTLDEQESLWQSVKAAQT